ncbi:MAG TPA: FAD-dependent oxidoreductase, partial [Thermoplasmata archaeon]|nr:FAD-dependent oxidoreductase [Thermoplasmata archaeon]
MDEFARRGAGRVAALDIGPVGGGTTGASAGVLTFQGWGAWDLELLQESATRLQAISEASGVAAYRSLGGLRVARTEEGVAWLHRVEGVLAESGVPAKLVGAAECLELCPQFDLHDVRAGLFTPDDALFSPVSITRELADRAASHGAFIRPAVGQLEVARSSHVWRARWPSGTIESPQLTLATGAWTKRLTGAIGVHLPIALFRAQARIVRPAPLLPEFPTLHDLDWDVYVRPFAPGRVLIGDGTERHEVELGEASATASEAFLQTSRESLMEVAPELLHQATEHAWAGVCVATPDPYPLVGPVPGSPGLHVAAGFHGLGAMRALAIARRLASGILDNDWAPLIPAHPGRFGADVAPFDPHPRFPLEFPTPGPAGPGQAGGRSAGDSDVLRESHFVSRSLVALKDVENLRLPSLSDWFDPFLRRFLADALRTGGSAEVAEGSRGVLGVFLMSREEGVASLFTRSRPVAAQYVERLAPGGLYTDAPWLTEGERIDVLAADLRDWELSSPLRHSIRIAGAEDFPHIRPM